MTTKITELNIANIANAGVQWQSVHVADGSTALNVTAGKGYFIDTTSATQSVNLPTSGNTVGDTIIIKDYARTFSTNSVTIAANNFDGGNSAVELNTNGKVVMFVYSGTVKGWQSVSDMNTTRFGPLYTEATGGTVANSGDYKVHSFTGDGCFVVSQVGNTAGGGNKVSYLVVAGGGGGGGGGPGGDASGGGGAGGFREGKDSGSPHTASPLAATPCSALTVCAQTYPITVGAGGSGGGNNSHGTDGSNSVFSTITSTGGGAGKYNSGAPSARYGNPGGSGGGSSGGQTDPGDGSQVGQGNTPPVSPPQGNPGGPATGSPDHGGNGGGGAGAKGGQGTGSPGRSGHGGKGVDTSISGASTSYAGGGGGGGAPPSGRPGGTGGEDNGSNAGSCAAARGGGGSGAPHPTPDTSGGTGQSGTANTGGGGGGAQSPSSDSGGTGGKGIVVIRYKFQN